MLTLGSLFNGISGWILAAERNGVKTLWESEIEKFCEAVTKYHFPDVEQLGDVTKIDGAAIPPVDIICAGSPCQDLSVAGKREGLQGERSGLFRTAVSIVRRMRMSTGGRQPRFFIWENVPGAFSSKKGMDFRVVLEEIGQTNIPMPNNGKWATAGVVECENCEIAWRVLDAQYTGVPQRRRRIFLIADFAKSNRCAAEILFEWQGVSGDSESCGETGKDFAGRIEKSVGNTSANVHRGGTFDIRISSDGTQNWRAHCYETEISRSLDTAAQNPDSNHGGVAILEDAPFVLESNQNHATITQDNISPTLPASMGMGGGYVPMITEDLSTVGGQNEIYDMHHAQDVIRTYKGKSPALISRMGTGGNNVPIVTENIPDEPTVFEPGVAVRDGGHIYTDGKCCTLRANPGDNAPTVVQDAYDLNATEIKPLERRKALDTSCRNCFGKQNATVVCEEVYALEGNGSRESHQGCGYSDTGKMYTLNTIERHAVAQVSIEGGQSAYAVGNGQLHQTNLSEKTGALNCMHDQIAVMQKVVTESKLSEVCAPMTDGDSTGKM